MIKEFIFCVGLPGCGKSTFLESNYDFVKIPFILDENFLGRFVKTAKSYVGKTIDQLVAAIGQYNSMDKSKSCLVDGEYDGMFYYDGFTVSASTENGVWVISSVD